jgi:hypothetical protein
MPDPLTRLTCIRGGETIRNYVTLSQILFGVDRASERDTESLSDYEEMRTKLKGRNKLTLGHSNFDVKLCSCVFEMTSPLLPN